MIVTNKINVYIHQNGQYHMDAVQGDTGRVLELALFSEAEPWELPREACVQVRFRKPDGTGGFYDTLPDGVRAYEVSGNVVTCALAPQMLTVPGDVEAQVLVLWGNKEVATFTVHIHVQKDPSLGVLESEDYVNLTAWVANCVEKNLETFAKQPLTLNGVAYNGSRPVTMELPSYRYVPDPEVYGRLTSKLLKEGFYFINVGTWTDFPTILGAGALLVFRYTVNYVLQIGVSLKTGEMQTRIVALETGEIYRDWKPMPHSCQIVTDPSLFDNALTNLTDEGFYALYSKDWRDYPFGGSGALLVFRYTPSYVLQIAVCTTTGRMRNRIVHKINHTVYRDWQALDGMRTPRILVVGDSIARGVRNGYKGFVGDLGAPYQNCAVSGATLSNVTDTYTQIPDQIMGVTDFVPEIIIADGGINDYIKGTPLGEMPQSVGVDPDAMDRSTVLGSLQCLLLRMQQKYPGVKGYFLLPHKILDWPRKANSAGYTQAELFDAIKAVCELHGVGVIDIFSEGCIDTSCSVYISPTAYTADNSVTHSQWVDTDGIHPLDYGYLHGYLPIIRRVLGLGGKRELEPKTITEIVEGNSRRGRFRLIERREVTQEGLTSLKFPGLNLLRFRAYLTVPKSSQTGSVGVAAYMGTTLVGYSWLSSMILTTADRVSMVKGENDDGLVSFGNTTPANVSANTQIYMENPNRIKAVGPFTNLEVSCNAVFPLGTVVELWGMEY